VRRTPSGLYLSSSVVGVGGMDEDALFETVSAKAHGSIDPGACAWARPFGFEQHFADRSLQGLRLASTTGSLVRFFHASTLVC
jgi:hypothetical protein